MLNLDLSELYNLLSRNNLCCQTVIRKLYDSTSPTYHPELGDAIQKVSSESLPKRNKPQPGWFQVNASKLLSLIETRNQAMKDIFKRRTRSATNFRKQERN